MAVLVKNGKKITPVINQPQIDPLQQFLIEKLGNPIKDVIAGTTDTAKQWAAIPQGIQAYQQNKAYQPPQNSEVGERGLSLIGEGMMGGNAEMGAVESNMGLIGKQVTGKAGQVADDALQAIEQAAQAQPGGFQAGGMQLGSKDPQLTTTILDRLAGRNKVSPEFIENLTRQKDVKQADALLAQKTLQQVGKDQPVDVPAFADKMREELLPLNILRNKPGRITNDNFYPTTTKYEHVSLPSEIKGNVAGYDEHIYQSPIKTSAGDVHFSGDGADNYFAHTRTEDLDPDLGTKPPFTLGTDSSNGQTIHHITNYNTGERLYSSPDRAEVVKKLQQLDNPNGDKTRRVIEIQSDLFQKGRLDDELEGNFEYSAGLHDADDIIKDKLTNDQYSAYRQNLQSADKRAFLNNLKPGLAEEIEGEVDVLRKSLLSSRQADVDKLKPYENTWHERVIREEVKKAAEDGKTKLQFPVGDTAMKIEGLGGVENRWTDFNDPIGPLTPNQLKPGLEIGEADPQLGLLNEEGDSWIITDVLGDGKFKAVPKEKVDEAMKRGEMFKFQGDESKEKIMERMGSNYGEEFDISGNVDKSNPIYKFYESRIGKYLQKKYGAQRVKDAQGVEWMQVDVPKEAAKKPVEAFAVAPLGIANAEEEKQKKKKYTKGGKQVKLVKK